MAFSTMHSGPHPATVQPCPLSRIQITVRDNESPEQEKPVVASKTCHVVISRNGAAVHEADCQTDQNGILTIKFTDAGEPAQHAYTITCAEVVAPYSEPADGPKYRKGPVTGIQAQQGQGPANRIYQGVALLTGCFTLKVRVVDLCPRDTVAPRAPIPLAAVALRLIIGGGPAADTTSLGDQWRTTRIEKGVAWSVGVPTGIGFIPATSMASRRLVGGAAATTDDGPVTDGCLTSRAHRPQNALVCDVTVTEVDVEVEIEFQLKFKTVFIVGESEQFRYAAQLARRYGAPLADRGLTQPQGQALQTVQSPERRWVIASQYDLTGGAPALDNVIVYRAPDVVPNKPGGTFDTTLPACWASLTQRFPELFDAIVFNNPHPGYGLHYATVKGLRIGDGNAGNYVSVHTAEYGGAGLTPANFALLKQRNDWDQPRTQRYFVRQAGQLSNVNKLNYACTVDNTLTNFTTTGRVGDAFGYRNVPDNQSYIDPAQFAAEECHYRVFVAMAALYDLILHGYRRHAPTAAKPGGWVIVNGSNGMADTVGGDIGGGVARLADQGLWRDQGAQSGDTYAHYETNFTHPDLHPSWLASGINNPGEPNLLNTRSFGYQKP